MQWDLATADEPLPVLFFKESDGWIEHHKGQKLISSRIILLSLLVGITSAMTQWRLTIRTDFSEVIHNLTCYRAEPSSLYQRQVRGQVSLLGLVEVSVVDGCTLFRYHVLQADVILARWLVRAQEVSESAAGWTH